MLTAATDVNPWAGAPTSLWRNNDLDPHRFATREKLCQLEAKEDKLALAIQLGRIPGLASQNYTERRRKKLEAVLHRGGITQPHW